MVYRLKDITGVSTSKATYLVYFPPHPIGPPPGAYLWWSCGVITARTRLKRRIPPAPARHLIYGPAADTHCACGDVSVWRHRCVAAAAHSRTAATSPLSDVIRRVTSPITAARRRPVTASIHWWPLGCSNTFIVIGIDYDYELHTYLHTYLHTSAHTYRLHTDIHTFYVVGTTPDTAHNSIHYE